MRTQWRDGQDRCARDIERHQLTDGSHMDEGIELLKPAKNAQRFLALQPPGETSRMLNFPVSNRSRANGELSADFKQPSGLLAETAALTTHAWMTGITDSGRFENGSPGRTRTSDPAVNSRLLYQLSYRGTLMRALTRGDCGL